MLRNSALVVLAVKPVALDLLGILHKVVLNPLKTLN